MVGLGVLGPDAERLALGLVLERHQAVLLLARLVQAAHLDEAGAHQRVDHVLARRRLLAQVQGAAIVGRVRVLHEAHLFAHELLAQELARLERIRL